jgi:hypothetical protein
VKARALALAAALTAAACATPPPVPPWQGDAFEAIETYRKHYLAGESKRAERDYAVARAAISSTGRLELAARLEVIRCALATAALDFDKCAGLDAALLDAGAEERAYGGFLAGRWQEIDARSLPAAYRGVAAAGSEETQNRALRQIEDPVSRLVAAGALLRQARLAPDSVAAAVEAASGEGLRRPLLAWLKVQEKLAESAGDAATLALIRRRIALVESAQPRAK